MRRDDRTPGHEKGHETDLSEWKSSDANDLAGTDSKKRDENEKTHLVKQKAAGVLRHVHLQCSDRGGVLRQNGLIFEFSLCLSRACLGKMIILM